MKQSSLAAFLIASLFVSTFARADSTDDVLKATPYRPTVSNPAELPVPGHLEWEAGGLAERDPGGDRHDSVPYLLKYALTEDFGMLIGGESFVSERSGEERTNGFGDTVVTMKFHHAVSSSMGVGLEAGAKLPTASNKLGSGHADFTLNGIVSQAVHDFDVDVNLSYTRLGSGDLGTGRGALGWAIAASHDLASGWGAAGEFSGTVQKGSHGLSQFLSAVSYSPRPDVVFDGGVTAGLNRNSPRCEVFVGVTRLVL